MQTIAGDASINPTEGAKKRVVRRKTDAQAMSSSTASADPLTSLSTSNNEATKVQIVHSQEEGNALVKRLKQLEAENVTLSHTLAKICEENAMLTGRITRLEMKVSELAKEPLATTSVLHSLFEPDKVGWFGGSKNTAREQLEQLADSLQTEFMNYKVDHASSNEEVQALMTALQAAHANASQLSSIVHEQQLVISSGPLAVDVRILPIGELNDSATGVIIAELKGRLLQQQDAVVALEQELKLSESDLKAKSAENIKLQSDLKALRDREADPPQSATDDSLQREVAFQRLHDENRHLREELDTVRQALTTEEQLHRLKKTECEALSRQVDSDKVDVQDLKRQLLQAQHKRVGGGGATHTDVEKSLHDLAVARQELDDVRQKLTAAVSEAKETKAQLLETQKALHVAEGSLTHTVPMDRFTQVDQKTKALAHEVELCKATISRLEKNASRARCDDESVASVDEAEVLDTLSRSKERISRLEFEKDQIAQQLQEAQRYAASRDQEAQRIERAALEDKQRVTFLLKKCAAVAGNLSAATAARDAISEDLEQHKVIVCQLQRQVDQNTSLQQQVDELTKQQEQMQKRISGTVELEEKLVKAKETIAWMELAQTQTINMSQYAELQAAKEKLEHTMEPLQKRLDEANKEVERLRAITSAQQVVTGTQFSSVRNMQDQLDALTTTEAKQREKVTVLSAENARLMSINASLEAQMSNMQGGIKEMAVQMDAARTSAKSAAEASAKKEVTDLQAELERTRATLATLQTTQGKFVAEGLYQSTVQERDRLAEESHKRAFDMEKLKSEILIYRQAISELEAENDEHVKEIESLQERYTDEKTNLRERLTVEQKRAAALASEVTALSADVKERNAKIDQMTSSVKELSDRNSRQTRAFEDKCRFEETLKIQLAALQEELTAKKAGRVADPAVSPPIPVIASEAVTALSTAPVNAAGGPLPATSTASNPQCPDAAEQLYRLQCEKDHLEGEMKRMQLKYKTDAEGDQRSIGMLQMQIKSRMPAELRSAYEAELNKSNLLTKSNAQLQQENEALKKIAADGGKTGSNSVHALAAVSTNAEELQLRVIELQRQLDLQKEGYGAAMSHAVADGEQKARRIAELEARLADQSNDGTLTSSPKLGGEGDPGEASASPTAIAPPTPEAPVKKVKRVRPKRSLAEQVAATEDPDDMLGTPAHLSVAQPNENAGDAAGLLVERQTLQANLLACQREREALRRDTAALQKALSALQQDLQQAHDKHEQAQMEFSKERAELEKRIHEHEAVAATSAPNSAGLPPLGIRENSTTGPSIVHERTPSNSSFLRQRIQELEVQIRCLQEENSRLQETDRSKASTNPCPNVTLPVVPADSLQDLKYMRKLLRQKDAEIRSLVEQLMPAKSKLVEYMAMADRLGVPYPFPSQFEETTLLRLKAHRVNRVRAVSAPNFTGGQPTAPQGSPAPRRP